MRLYIKQRKIYSFPVVFLLTIDELIIFVFLFCSSSPYFSVFYPSISLSLFIVHCYDSMITNTGLLIQQ